MTRRILKISAGDRFGRLTAVEYVGRDTRDMAQLWLFRCDCGKEKVRIASAVIAQTRACQSCATRDASKRWRQGPRKKINCETCGKSVVKETQKQRHCRECGKEARYQRAKSYAKRRQKLIALAQEFLRQTGVTL